MSRLAYFNNDQFLNKYVEIFNISELSGQFKKLKNLNFSKTDIFGLKTDNLLEISKQINKINYTHKTVPNLSSSYIKYIMSKTPKPEFLESTFTKPALIRHWSTIGPKVVRYSSAPKISTSS